MRSGFRVATLEETLHYGRAGLVKRKLYPPMAGGAEGVPTTAPRGAAVVGSFGTAVTSVSGGTASPAWGTGSTQVVNNRGLAWVIVIGATTAALPTTPSGWGLTQSSVGTSLALGIYTRVLTGGDAAPTFTAAAGFTVTVSLAEITGSVHQGTAKDNGGVGNGTTSPQVCASAAVDQQAGEFFCGIFGARYSAAATASMTPTLNNGTANQFATNAGTSTTDHFTFVWALTTSIAAAWSISTAFTTTNATAGRSIGVSYNADLLSGPTVIPQAQQAAMY